MEAPEPMNDAEEVQKKKRTFFRKALLVAITVVAAAALSLMILAQIIQPNCGIERWEGELAAMSAALTSYAAEHGRFPANAATDHLRTASASDPSLYVPASQHLYKILSGDSDGDPRTRSPNDTKVYFEFKPDMLRPSPPGPGTYIVDPFGNSYGYSTFKAKNPTSTGGYNITFDLWSTRGGNTEKHRKKWRTNW